jgi:hypothetical protein
MGRLFEMWSKFSGRSLKSSVESDIAEECLSNPSELLFTMASISDECPYDPLAARADETMRSINEDDWLQIEFFPISEFQSVKRELSKLFRHIELHRSGWGFSEIYLRQSVTQLPLIDYAINLRPYWKNRSPLAVGGHSAPLVFQAEFPCGWRLYALESPNMAIMKLGIQPAARNASEEFLVAVQDCCAKKSLQLLDWEQIKVVDTNSLTALRDWADLQSTQFTDN